MLPSEVSIPASGNTGPDRVAGLMILGQNANLVIVTADDEI